MSRYSSSGSYSHGCTRWGRDDYEISWLVDRYYTGVRMRFPRTGRRYTDEAGARRFCKKWGCKFPEEPK
jgi:hypothetical protein